MRVGSALLTVALMFSAEVWASPAVTHIAGSCSPEAVQTLSLSCSGAEPCPLFLELASVEASGNRIFATGNIHTDSATIESVLLVSEDAGASWAEAHARIPFAVLDQIQFIDIESGWITGHVLQPVPRDAFLLLTTDGGKTWRKRPIAGESRPGVIEQLWFDSPKHGALTIDRVRSGEDGFRYEMWESMTGGESWSVRQVNREPLSLKRPERVSIWRIQPDAHAKANRIEKLESGKWLPLGAFSVAAGECKPAETESVTAPPESPGATPPESSPGSDQAPSSASPGRKPPSLKR